MSKVRSKVRKEGRKGEERDGTISCALSEYISTGGIHLVDARTKEDASVTSHQWQIRAARREYITKKSFESKVGALSKVLDFNFDDGTVSYESSEARRKRNEKLVGNVIG